jgi:hypothetical protein
MTSKLPYEKNHKNKIKSCFKFVLLTKKFKEKKTNITFLKKILNGIIKYIKIHNILDIIEIKNL